MVQIKKKREKKKKTSRKRNPSAPALCRPPLDFQLPFYIHLLPPTLPCLPCLPGMMRSKPSSSLQKTYDECYLICSTAVYFEGQVLTYLPDRLIIPLLIPTPPLTMFIFHLEQ